MILRARATQGGRGGEVRWRQFRCVAREGRFVALSDFVRDERAEVFADDDVPCSRSLGVGELQVQVRFQHLGDILEVILRFARVPFDVGESTKARAPLRERARARARRTFSPLSSCFSAAVACSMAYVLASCERGTRHLLRVRGGEPGGSRREAGRRAERAPR